MSRKKRFNIPGIPYHICQKGHNHARCFLENEDFDYYADCMREASELYACDIHAYVLLPNKINLLITPNIESGISKFVQAIGRRYVRYFNQKYERTGTLWGGRYKSSLIQSEFILACYFYIESKPISENLVESPVEYFWSSFHCNVSGIPNDIITPHSSYLSLGISLRKSQKVYKRLYIKGRYVPRLKAIEIALEKEMVFGDTVFKREIEQQTNRPAQAREPGRPCNVELIQ